MPCFHPLKGYQSKSGGFTVSRRGAYVDKPMQVACGQCIGCRLERSRQWAVRCYHEASLYDHNCFITLTFDDAHLPKDRSLDVRYFQKFMKRLRKRFGSSIRFFHCGEYGERFGRPHYHACLFNFDFPDKEFWRQSRGSTLYISNALTELWPFGFSTIGDVTFESAAYVARYITKKINGAAAAAHYELIDLDTGEIFDRKPEYVTMSRRPGIAKGWLDKFMSDVYPSDFVVINGRKVRPPRYYDTQYEIEYPEDHELLKGLRVLNSKKYVDNNTEDRLAVRERCQLARFNMLPRGLEKEI